MPKTADKPWWIIRRSGDDRVLCEDGLFRMHVSPEKIKLYRTLRGVNAAIRRRYVDSYHAVAIYVSRGEYVNAAGQVCDVDGKVVR